MTTRRSERTRVSVSGRWALILALTGAWVLSALLAVQLSDARQGVSLACCAATGLVLSIVVVRWYEWRQWITPGRMLADRVTAQALNPGGEFIFDGPPGMSELSRSLRSLSEAYRHDYARVAGRCFTPPGESGTHSLRTPMSRSGLFDPPSEIFETRDDPTKSSEFTPHDMVNRLEPRLLRWLESSPAEQNFLGWSLRDLREKSFLEIVHPDDLERVKQGLRTALAKGEIHGLIVRIRTASGKARAIELNVGARYGPEMSVSHLRCHITDVTAKLRADRELRLRTRELMQVNEQLRLMNREIEELKERYRDLYENSPAMYFSLDNRGAVLECNDTLLRTLGYRRDQLVGVSYEMILAEPLREQFRGRFAAFLRQGHIEVESRWVKADGGEINVWVSGSAVRGDDGRILHSRSVAQDVTARNRLEAELKEKHVRLSLANAELSKRNREMDEFTYVVSHDLQEPLRTMIAFSDFLSRDYGDRLDAEGQEFVHYIVDASRRMRSLIQDLLSLSRLGRVTSDFTEVSLDDVVATVRADLSELVRSRNAEIKVAGPLPVLWADPVRIRQLLSNLIINGLKYNRRDVPTVEVGASETEDLSRVILYVRDDGIGIDSQFHAKIFQLFRRLHTREEYEGTGAGLAICSKIVQAHGGKIWVQSEPNQGATFYVSMPKARESTDHPTGLAPREPSAPSVALDAP